ncbi:MAG TPA: PKD domain-containing protein [Planctomycetota bacterium]|nr:PKD domain-containing protein [Planctomycetota bacterium]
MSRLVAMLVSLAAYTAAGEALRLPVPVHNLLLDAKVSGNLEGYKLGLRGAPDHLVYDLKQQQYVKPSQWHEYGVGFGKELGVVPEDKPAFWMAEWPKPVEANLIVLSGVYPNQPQPETCWKIELRREGKWTTHASGKGGWYDSGRYTWGGPGGEQVTFDALRVSVFSKDAQSPIKSVHFRGEEGASWVVANLAALKGAPVEARIEPLRAPVMAGQTVAFAERGSIGKIETYKWDFGDGATVEGARASHAFAKPGIYKVTLAVTHGDYSDECPLLLRVHTQETLHVPQVHLDTDQKNEVDDQHYFGYGLFSELDVLGINSIHHGGGQEPINYAEILNVLDLAKKSGLPKEREPFVFRGANRRLEVPASGKWDDTVPIATAASKAILGAARGASPSNPAWVVPVGPGTNVACAILQARAEGLELKDRLKVMWLGGSNTAITGEFNGNNDPWSLYVVCQSGLETWIMPAPVGGRIKMDVTKEADLYPANPLGDYLRKIVPKHSKSLYDPSCLSAIISMRLGLGWVKESEPVTVGGPKEGYRWTKTNEPTPVRVIRQIDQEAMKRDVFDTMKGRPTRVKGQPTAEKVDVEKVKP